MLYQLYEAQRSMMEPFSDLAKVASKVYSNPATPLGQVPFSQRTSAGFDLMHRLLRDYEKPEFGIRTVDVDGVAVAIDERIEMALPFCDLRRFKRFSDDVATLDTLKGQPAVLVVAPLSGHHSTLLRDTVQTMLRDHKVYITDWKNARNVPLSEGEFHLDDYVNYVQDFIRHLQGIYGNCHVVSVCQPTVPVLAAVSLMASRGEMTPLSMTMMGGPIDARKSPTSVNDLAVAKSHKWFETNVIYRVPSSFPGAGRRVYPGFLQHSGFLAMNPDNHARSHYDYFQDLIKGDDASTEQHRKFYDEYNAVLDMDADYYLETIKVVFQDFMLVNGTWDVKSPSGKMERVRPQDIRNTGLFSIEGELDDISGSGQTEAVHAICAGVPKSDQKHLEVKGAGHYGIFAGRRWRDVVYPQVKSFILEHQATMKASEAPKAPAVAASTAGAVEEAFELTGDGASVKSAAPAAKRAPAKRAAAPRARAVASKTATKPAAKKAVKAVATADEPVVVATPPVVAEKAPVKRVARARKSSGA